MVSKFTDKRILITGASRGIGRRLALDFGAMGAKVAVNFHSSSSEAEAVVTEIASAGGEAFAVQADVGNGDDVRRMFEGIKTRFGGIDVLVNSAGINRDAPFIEMTEDDWDTVINANLKGPFLCCREAARIMAGVGGGRIINMSAISSLKGRANAANYSASKGGLNALTRALAVDLGPEITVNAIALGFFDSPLVREVFTDDQVSEVEAGLPTGRIGTFEEVSALTQYLASDAAGFVTGQTISIDGGQSIVM